MKTLLYWLQGGEETAVIRYKIKEVAQQKGISQTRLGQLALLDMERMRRIWRDGNSDSANITMQVLDRIARALQVDASELIESVRDTPESTKQGNRPNDPPPPALII